MRLKIKDSRLLSFSTSFSVFFYFLTSFINEYIDDRSFCRLWHQEAFSFRPPGSDCTCSLKYFGDRMKRWISWKMPWGGGRSWCKNGWVMLMSTDNEPFPNPREISTGLCNLPNSETKLDYSVKARETPLIFTHLLSSSQHTHTLA